MHKDYLLLAYITTAVEGKKSGFVSHNPRGISTTPALSDSSRGPREYLSWNCEVLLRVSMHGSHLLPSRRTPKGLWLKPVRSTKLTQEHRLYTLPDLLLSHLHVSLLNLVQLHSFYLFKNIFIYLLVFGCAGSSLPREPFSVAASGAPPQMRCAGFSAWGSSRRGRRSESTREKRGFSRARRRHQLQRKRPAVAAPGNQSAGLTAVRVSRLALRHVGSSRIRDRICVSCIGRRIPYR